MSQISFHKRAPSLASRHRPHWPSRHLNESPPECGVRTEDCVTICLLMVQSAPCSLPALVIYLSVIVARSCWFSSNILDAFSLQALMVTMRSVIQANESKRKSPLHAPVADDRRMKALPHATSAGHWHWLSGVHCHWSPGTRVSGPMSPGPTAWLGHSRHRSSHNL